MRKYLLNMSSVIFSRMKNTNIINERTKLLLIDKSLKKDLEIANNRKLRIKKNEENKEKDRSCERIEMSESHDTKPYIKNPDPH